MPGEARQQAFCINSFHANSANFICAYAVAMKTNQSGSRTIFVGALCTFLLPLLFTPASGAADRIAGGKWEAAMTTDGATRTVSFCISAEEATSINGDSKSGRDFAEKKAQKSGSPCVMKSYDIKGDTVSYALACGNRTITDTTSFHGETSEGVKTVTLEGNTVTTRFKSRRLGVC